MVMLKAYTSNLVPQLIWNFDATQLTKNNNSNPDYVYTAAENGNSNPLTYIGDEILPVGVKWLHMGSAHGEYADLVVIIAIDSMQEDDYWVKSIPGLSQSNKIGSSGYLVFCKTRAANTPFYEWFVENIVIATLNNCRDWNKLKVCYI
jgi:hypothetical protein